MGWNVANMVTNYGYYTKWSRGCIEVLVSSQWAGVRYEIVQNGSCAYETVLNFRAQQFQGWFFVWFGDPLFDLTRINTTLLDKYYHQNHFGEKNRAVVRFAWPFAFSCVETCRFGRRLKIENGWFIIEKRTVNSDYYFFFKTTTLINPCWPLLSCPQDTRVSRPNLRKWLPHTWSFGDLGCGNRKELGESGFRFQYRWHSFASNWKMYTMCCAMSFSDGCSIFYILFHIGVCRCFEHPIVWAQARFPSRIISRHIYLHTYSMCIASSQRFYVWETFRFNQVLPTRPALFFEAELSVFLLQSRSHWCITRLLWT